MTQAIRSRVRAGLRRGAERTAGQELVATIERMSGADETTYPPVPGTAVEYTSTALLSWYSTDERDGANIRSEDVKILLSWPLVDSAGNTTEPQVSDWVTVAGATYDVVDVMALRPGGSVLMWSVQGRASSG